MAWVLLAVFAGAAYFFVRHRRTNKASGV